MARPTGRVTYLALGSNGVACQAANRELFRHALDPGVVDQIHQATRGNYALGNDRFAEQVSEMLGRRVTPGKAGRPRKTQEA